MTGERVQVAPKKLPFFNNRWETNTDDRASGFHRLACPRHLLPGCIQWWHGIEKGSALNEVEVRNV